MDKPTPAQTRQTLADAKRAIVEAIPEVLREDYAALSARASALDKQIDALKKQRRQVSEEQERILVMAAQESEGDAALLALRHGSTAGYQRFQTAVRALHPQMFDSMNWSPADAPEGTVPTAGPYLALTYVKPSLEAVDVESLADALVEFARRFVPVVPNYGDYPGKVYTDILTSHEYDRTCLWYAPDGSQATLIRYSRFDSEEPVEGTLVEVLRAALALAIADRDAADRDDENPY